MNYTSTAIQNQLFFLPFGKLIPSPDDTEQNLSCSFDTNATVYVCVSSFTKTMTFKLLTSCW